MSPEKYHFEKSINALLYIASKLKQADFYKVLKVMYFADLYHLDNFISLIADDKYVAMDNGPVPSLPYDIVKVARGQDGVLPSEHDLPDNVQRIREAISLIGNYTLKANDEPNDDFFSVASKESFDYAIEKYGEMTFGQLKNLSHDDAYNATSLNETINLADIANMVDDSGILSEHLRYSHA